MGNLLCKLGAVITLVLLFVACTQAAITPTSIPVTPTAPLCTQAFCEQIADDVWELEQRVDASGDMVAFGIGYDPNPNPTGVPTATPQPTPTPPTSLSNFDYLSFNVTATVPLTPTEGRVYWNDDENTLNVTTDVSGTELQVGLESYVFGVNKTGDVITNGYAVYISGAQGNRPTFALATAGTYTEAQAVGIATQDIADNEAGYVTVYGNVRGIDTRNYTEGAELWLANDGGGAITTTVPTTGCKVLLGTALNSTVNGTILVNPSWRCDIFGDAIAGNYSDFEADGTLAFHGDARVWDDLRVPAQSSRINPTQTKPDFGTFIDGTLTYLFDPDDEESVHFAAQVPHSWDTSYPYLFSHVHWTPIDTNTGNVVWGIECSTGAIGQALGSTLTYTATGAATGTAFKHIMTDMGTYTITNPTVSSMLVCRLFRAGDDGADTYASDAALLETDFHYLINTVGSREEDAK